MWGATETGRKRQGLWFLSCLGRFCDRLDGNVRVRRIRNSNLGKPVYNNKVTMSGGEVCTVVGACAVALPGSTAYNNTVIINGGTVKTVYGALSDTADVIGNVVIVSGGTVSCKLTAGDSGSGAVRDNRVYLLGQEAKPQ